MWSPTIFRGNNSWLEKVAGGWTIAGILNTHSGFPWTPVINTSSGANGTCNVVYQNSGNTNGGNCNLRPQTYAGGAGSDYNNATFMKPNGNFPQGALSYFTVPTVVQGSPFPGVGPIPPPPGVGRNSFRGPRYFDIDMTLGKSFGLPTTRVLGENAKVEFRANFFNLFNHLNLLPFQSASPSTTVSYDGTSSNPQFGEAQSALGARVIELQARFSF